MTTGGESAHGIISAAMSSGSYDSILGDRQASVGTYREFVVYDNKQVYPSYLLLYSHKQDATVSSASSGQSTDAAVLQHGDASHGASDGEEGLPIISSRTDGEEALPIISTRTRSLSGAEDSTTPSSSQGFSEQFSLAGLHVATVKTHPDV